jgi:RNA polymerase sigma-70 factor, ECF subfamily
MSRSPARDRDSPQNIANDDEKTIRAEVVLRGVGGEVSDLVATLLGGLSRARDDWPTAELSCEAFVDAVLRRATAQPGDVRANVAGLRLAELYLATACSLADLGAILAFEDAFFGEIERAFSVKSSGDAFVDDARQNLRERLFVGSSQRPAEIASYGGRGSLRRWFRLVLTHHTLNFKRSEARAPLLTEPDYDQALLTQVDPELLYLRERYASDFRAATEDAARQLLQEDRLALQHHYVERLSIDRIASIYGIHRVTAARRVNRARDEWVTLVRAALRARLSVDEAELRSILRLLPTQFSMSLQRVLRSPANGSEGA